jgi:hypothetical protein
MMLMFRSSDIARASGAQHSDSDQFLERACKALMAAPR